MAKYCEVCKSSYPDGLDACPHCAGRAAGETSSDSAVDLGLPGAPGDPLAGEAPVLAEAGDSSVVQWASVVENAPASGAPAPPEEDFVGTLAEPPAARDAGPASPPAAGEEATLALTPGAEAAPPAGGPAPFPEVGSGIDLGAAAAEDKAGAPSAAGSDSEIHLGEEPAAVESGVEPVGDVAPVDSGVVVAEDAVVAESGVDLAAEAAADTAARPATGSDSEIHLAEDAVPAESGVVLGEEAAPEESGVVLAEEDIVAGAVVAGSGVDLSAEAADSAARRATGSDSEIHLGEEAPAAESGVELAEEAPVESGVELVEDAAVAGSGVDLAAEAADSAAGLDESALAPARDSAVDLGADVVVAELASGAGKSDSGRDLIAEAVESGVDLHRAGADAAAAAPVEESAEEVGEEKAVDLNEAANADAQSSAVDLGAPAAGDVLESGAGEGAVGSAKGEGSGAPRVEAAAPSGAALSGVLDDETGAPTVREEAVGAVDEYPADEGEEATELATVPAGEDEEGRPSAGAARPRPEKKERRKSRAGAWVGGALIGGLVGVGACVALWVFAFDQLGEWRLALGGGNKVPPPGGPQNPGRPGPGAAGPKTVGDKQMEFLQEAAAKGPILPGNEAFKTRLAELEKDADKDADALFWKGVLLDAAGDANGAKQAFAAGAKKFENDPAQKQRFETAIIRLETRPPAKPVARKTGAAPAADPLLLALAATTFEPAQPPQADAPAAEAGVDFWRAVKEAQSAKYAEAVKALDAAAAAHDKRRLTLLGKAQNPNSDPTEEIFLRSCAELKEFWQLKAKLVEGGYLTAEKKDPVQAINDLAKKAKEADDLRGQLDTAKEDVKKAEKAAKDAKADADAEAKKDIEAAKKAADADAAKKVEDAKKEAAAAAKKEIDATKLDAEKAKKDADDKAKDAEAKVKDALDLAEKTKESLAKAEKRVKELETEKDPQGTVRRIQGELDKANDQLAKANEQLKQRWQPAEMLSLWAPLVKDRTRKDLAEKALADADRVLKDEASPAAAKGQAHAVRGLVLLGQGKYADAKAELEKAKPAVGGDWAGVVDAALKEAADPSASLVAQVKELRDRGQTEQALTALDKLVEGAAPESRGRLLAERALLRLDQARGKGRLKADDPDVVAAMKDADEAAKGGDAEAFYAEGRIAEALERFDAAAENYQKAFDAHKALDAQGARYRVALARVLLQAKPAKAAEGARSDRGAAPTALDLLTLLVAAGPEEPPAGAPDAASKRAQELADEVLAAKEGDVPFEVRAQALAIKGLWNQALTTYIDGLKPHLSREHYDGLMALIQGHPAMKRPTSQSVANPLEAERRFGAGQRLYFDRQFANAEKEFVEAVAQNGQDARYFYFLGLSRLAQGKRSDALADFEQGARLEDRNRPPPAAVNAELERIQGPDRRTLNGVRDLPR
jgi:hypothetical protein